MSHYATFLRASILLDLLLVQSSLHLHVEVNLSLSHFWLGNGRMLSFIFSSIAGFSYLLWHTMNCSHRPLQKESLTVAKFYGNLKRLYLKMVGSFCKPFFRINKYPLNVLGLFQARWRIDDEGLIFLNSTSMRPEYFYSFTAMSILNFSIKIMFPGKFNSQYSLVKFLSLNLKILWKEQFSKISTSKGYRSGETFHNHHTIGTSERERLLFLRKPLPF